VSGLRGNPQKIRDLHKAMRELPTTLAQNVAARIAPILTSMARAAYTGGQTVYGEVRPRGVYGDALDLHETGETFDQVRFVAIGTVVRARLGTPHARYLIGKYQILPMGTLPVDWAQTIGEAARDEIRRSLP
jgi:hypothetical protein